MSRKRVPKGQVFLKKEEKLLATIAHLDANYSDDEFISKFKELYPEDWGNIVKRYDAHEQLTPKGKVHPMPPPPKYLLNISHKYRNKE